ncbi:MAG TPA: protein kinase [Pyrinomonadaceae bacterium]|nr:protein kinase [Pyrinomonadaceae bacterium]
MKPERWQQLDELFHAALEREPGERAAFLDEACAGDEPLRTKLESLLDAHEKAGSFIESPAMDVEARGIAAGQESAREEMSAGETISHYRIIAPLGVGGMGQVFLAHDVTLGRKVALKLLPAEFTRNPDRVRRFKQEARAASSLNHPNIITIHEIAQAEDRQFIATEYVEGLTLRDYLAETQSRPAAGGNQIGLELSEVLSITMQVASALSAAHAKGIVHRDIKPENIMLVQHRHLMEKESLVKVLDFGIAKLTEPFVSDGVVDATTKVLLNTNEGSVIGTAAYMSPEQARGEVVDARTDVWSLGIVIYEMLSNMTPFSGDTTQDVIASILRDDLPPLPAHYPDELKWVLKKALRKDREERYQTARELFSDLRDLREIQLSAQPSRLTTHDKGRAAQASSATIDQPLAPTGEAPSVTTATNENVVAIKRLGWGAGVGLLALLVAVAGLMVGLYKLLGHKAAQPGADQTWSSFQQMKMTKLTSTGKAADAAAISPDGKWVVYAVQDGLQESLWMRQVLTSSNVQIVPPADVLYLGLTFSPDGTYLYYIASDKTNPYTLFRMPALGGTATKLITDIDSNVTFSPDRKQFAFVRGYPSAGKIDLIVANADGTGERPLATRPISPGNFGDPAWSPDGKIIAYPVESSDTNGWTIQQVKVADGSVTTISPQRWWQPDYLRWFPDGSRLMFSAQESIASPSQIWYLSYPGGETHRVTNDLNDYVGVSLSSDPAVLITLQSENVSNIWIAPNNNLRQAHQITTSKLDGTQGLSWTPDGKIVYASGASGRWDLWITDTNGTSAKQLTADAGNNLSPSVSPDGQYIAFVSDRTGSKHIWRIDIDGSNAKQLTNDRGEWNPQFLPNSQGVLYETTKAGFWKVPIDGGQPLLQVSVTSSAGIAISPDGKWVAASYWEPLARKTAIYPVEGNASQKILDILTLLTRWTPDGHALATVDENNNSTIMSYGIDDGSRKQLIDVAPDKIFSFAWSRDGKQLAVARGRVSKDVVLITNFKERP